MRRPWFRQLMRHGFLGTSGQMRMNSERAPPSGRPGGCFPGCQGPEPRGQSHQMLPQRSPHGSSLVPAAPAGGRQGRALTTEPSCVVPGFEAARDAGRAERTPGALLIGDDGLPIYLPVAPVRASTRGLQGPGLGQGRRGPCPTAPAAPSGPTPGVRELEETRDVLGKERRPPD